MSTQSLIKANLAAMSHEDLVKFAMGLYNNQSAALKYLSENEEGNFTMERHQVAEIEKVHSECLTMTDLDFDSLENKRKLYDLFQYELKSKVWDGQALLTAISSTNKELKKASDINVRNHLHYKLDYYFKMLYDLEIVELIKDIQEEIHDLGGLDKLNSLPKDFNAALQEVDIKSKSGVKELNLSSLSIFEKAFEEDYESGYSQFSIEDTQSLILSGKLVA